MSRNKETQKKRHRARCVQAYRMHAEDGLSIRAISTLFEDKTDKQISAMVKIGERFANCEPEKQT